MNIFTKFHKDWTKIVDFLLIAKFLASANNFGTPSSFFDREDCTTYSHLTSFFYMKYLYFAGSQNKKYPCQFE